MAWSIRSYLRRSRPRRRNVCDFRAWFQIRPWSGWLDRLGVKRVPGRAHRTNEIKFRFPIDRLAQAADMHVHRARLDMNIRAPDRIQQFLAGKNPARMLHEKFKQTEFSGPQMHGAAIALH